MSGYEKEHISLLLDSRYRNRGTIEKPFWYIDNAITFSKDPRKSYRMRLQDTQIPKSFYEINQYNNVFRVIEDDGGAGDLIIVTIPPGNYTISELLAELESELDANTANSNDYTIDYDVITNKITIYFTGTSTQITIDTIANGSTLNNPLGLGIADTAFITGSDNQIVILAGAGNAATGSFAVDLNTISYITIDSSVASNNYYNNQNVQNIGGNIPMNVDRNEVKLWENHQGHKSKISSLNPLTMIELILKDEDSNPIDLNGVNWSTNLVIYELTETWKE